MFKLVLIYIVAFIVSTVSTEWCTSRHGRLVCYPITTRSASSTANALVTDLRLFTILVYPVALCIVFLGVLTCSCCCRSSKTFTRQRESSAPVAGLSRATETHAPSSSRFADQSNNNILFTEVMVGPSIISQDPPPPYTLQPDPSLPPPYEAVVNGGFEELQICDGRTPDTSLWRCRYITLSLRGINNCKAIHIYIYIYIASPRETRSSKIFIFLILFYCVLTTVKLLSTQWVTCCKHYLTISRNFYEVIEITRIILE